MSRSSGRKGSLAYPSRPLSRPQLAARLRQARKEDWDYRRGTIFGSMCTQPMEEAVRAARPFVTANLGNPGLCPGTARLEEELVRWLLELFHGPRFGAGGSIVTGGTEANLTALWVARNVSGGTEVALPRSAHFSFVKALDLLSLKPRWIPVDSKGRSIPHKAARAITRKTAAVIAVAGSTELGAVDPVEELSELALEAGVHLHVDAAFGGFVLPFLKEAGREYLPFDFSLEGVSSLAVDPHKLGGAPVPSGALLFREVKEAGSISVDSPYLSSPAVTALLGTRPSANVAATFAALARMGRSGHIRTLRQVLALTQRIADEGQRMGLELVTDPMINIVAFRHRNPAGVQAEMLRKGWDVSAIREPGSLRFVVMPHVTEESVARMLRDLRTVLRGSPPNG